MPARRPDLYTLALLDIHGIVPTEVIEAVIKKYEEPQPVNYETAVEVVHGAIHELIESGVFGEMNDGDDEDNEDLTRLPVATKTPVPPPSDNSVAELGHFPPRWFITACIDAYERWNELCVFTQRKGN